MNRIHKTLLNTACVAACTLSLAAPAGRLV